jgi:signal transduction histidine kinase
MTHRLRSILAVVVAVFVTVPAPLVGWRAGHLLAACHGLPQTVGFLVPGILAVVGRPDHRAARRLFALGLTTGLGFSVGAVYSAYSLSHPVPVWAGIVVLALQALDLGTGALLLSLMAVFPDGGYQRGYERVVVRVGAGLVVTVIALERATATVLTYPGAFIWTARASAPNPAAGFGLAGVGRVAWVAYQAAFPILVAAGITLLVLRFRRFGARERSQIAWPLLGAFVTLTWIVLLGGLGSFVRDQPEWLVYLLYAPAAMAVPVAVGVGILRRDVLVIDDLVRRCVAFAALWLLITAASVGAAVGLGVLAGRAVPLALAIGLTAAVTLVAEPMRRRLERLSERLVFGHQVSGTELIAALGARLESTTDITTIVDTVAADIRIGLRAAWVQVALDDGGSGVVAASGTAPADHEAAATVHLVRAGVRIGTITCGPRWDRRYSAADRQLLESLGRLAALVVHNAHLVTDLGESLEALRASRRRLVTAHDEGRRRLERDLHDGVQQELVALLAQMALARNQLRRDRELGQQSLDQAQRAAQHALVAVQELARGIHPTVLTDHGLVVAVTDRASRMPIPVAVQAERLSRFSTEVEGAAYFVVAEALGNVLKHAGATQAWVQLETPAEDVLRVAVRDDGAGFDPRQVALRGLLGLRDRVEAQGGQLSVVSSPGCGTRVTATVDVGSRCA